MKAVDNCNSVILVCKDPKVDATDISTKCSKFASAKTCKKNSFVRNRCQLSCGVCVGGKLKYWTN